MFVLGRISNVKGSSYATGSYRMYVSEWWPLVYYDVANDKYIPVVVMVLGIICDSNTNTKYKIQMQKCLFSVILIN